MGKGAALGGGIVAAGIACTHYTGMWALEVPGHLTWSAGYVAASILIGMLFGIGAMVLCCGAMIGAPCSARLCC